MRDFRPTSSAIAPPEDSLQASVFAHISADTYTVEQVEQMTQVRFPFRNFSCLYSLFENQ